MCKLYTSFPLLVYTSLLLLSHSLPTSQDDHYTLKPLLFDLTTLMPHIWFRVADDSAFLKSLRGTEYCLRTFFKHVEKNFATWLGEYITIIQHVFDKKFELFAVYCTVHGNLFSFFVTFKLNSTAKYWNHVAICKMSSINLFSAPASFIQRLNYHLWMVLKKYKMFVLLNISIL